jgi:hypothetical protein
MIARTELYDQIGRIMIDINYNTNTECLFYYLFENSEFFMKFWSSRKFYGELGLSFELSGFIGFIFRI